MKNSILCYKRGNESIFTGGNYTRWNPFQIVYFQSVKAELNQKLYCDRNIKRNGHRKKKNLKKKLWNFFF